MKNVFIIFVFLSIVFSCGKKEADKQKSIDMITIRTLGLAYLEENNLNEAEIKFKKLIEIAPDEANGYANLALVYIRKADYDKAEEQIKNALQRSPDEPDIRLNLAEIYELTGRESEAIATLESTLKTTPDHNRSLYKLAQVQLKSTEPEAAQKAQGFLAQVAKSLPANLPARLQLIEITLRNGDSDQALMNMEEIRRQLPELPSESADFFQKAIALMQAEKAQDALVPTMIFHNFMRVTPLYQAGIQALKGPAGPLMGMPLLSFSLDISIQMQEQEAILDAIRFTDATEGAGLNVVNERLKNASSSEAGALAIADFDGDGDQDIYLSVWLPNEHRNLSYLFKNDFGQFVDRSAETGIRHEGKDRNAIFADYDNDGFLDLFIINSERNLLYANIASGKFSNIAQSAGVANALSGVSAQFADFDHDSDLDLYLATNGVNQLFRYNGDNTYTELAEKMGIDGTISHSRDIAFGDFDEDGDLDFFVVNEDASNILYSNLRQGRFENITQQAGIANHPGSGAVAVGDYNNDGFLDIFVTALENGIYQMYLNKGDGTFEEDRRSRAMLKSLQSVRGLDTRFFDFDNDGFLDIVVVGEPINKSTHGVLLFHNDGTGKFEDTSSLLPAELISGQKVVIADYNEDGDLDLFIQEQDGSIRLLRNDGGNVNKYLKVQLVGLRTGSGKNNHFGIGSKLEVRAGDLYQIRVVDEPVTHLGLGQRLKADVVRILWPNGTPQNLFYPGSDQDLIEEQTLKGSCAFIYTWTGEKYEFVTDIIWRSALGMPLGIMGGETAYASPNSSQDYFKIPGEMLKPKDGAYSVQITEELWETAYFDQTRLIAIDHPGSVEIFIDERFVPPPVPPLKIFTVTKKQTPVSAIDDKGNNLLPAILQKDDIFVSNLIPSKYQGITELHDLILDLGDLSREDDVVLFLQGWIFPADASINVALAQSNILKVIFPHLQVIDENGKWQTVIPDLSFPMGKNKTVIADLSNKFLAADHRVRIRTNMEIYWDHIFFTVNEPKVPIQQTTLKPVSADIHYRGFSRLHRRGGRYGPHWFDYSDVSTDPKWRDLVGNYTRYGDVLPLLLESDSKFVIINAGDEITVQFDAKQVPELKSSWSRDFLIFGDGWIKDGDLNTAHGKTVEPLPYQGMSRYPYGLGDAYPMNNEYKEFIEKYNTRKVGLEAFRKKVKSPK